MEIAYTLKKLRKKSGLTQEIVAKYLHMSQSAYARMEKGETKSWSHHIKPLCKLYNIELQDLIK